MRPPDFWSCASPVATSRTGMVEASGTSSPSSEPGREQLEIGGAGLHVDEVDARAREEAPHLVDRERERGERRDEGAAPVQRASPVAPAVGGRRHRRRRRSARGGRPEAGPSVRSRTSAAPSRRASASPGPSRRPSRSRSSFLAMPTRNRADAARHAGDERPRPPAAGRRPRFADGLDAP